MAHETIHVEVLVDEAGFGFDIEGFGAFSLFDPVIHRPELELHRMVWISLGTWARAQEGDDVPEGSDPRGWWGESYSTDPLPLGTRLWQVLLKEVNEGTMAEAEEFAEEALGWMIRDGVAATVEATASTFVHDDRLRVGLSVVITQPQPVAPRFEGFWEATIAARR